MEQQHYTVTIERTSSRRRKKQRERMRRRVCGAIAFISFFFLLGSVGAVEQDTIGLTQGIIQMTLGMGALLLFTWLAGGFDSEDS